MEAFSDGVMAIIITIMVLELRAPHEATLAALRPLAWAPDAEELRRAARPIAGDGGGPVRLRATYGMALARTAEEDDIVLHQMGVNFRESVFERKAGFSPN